MWDNLPSQMHHCLLPAMWCLSEHWLDLVNTTNLICPAVMSVFPVCRPRSTAFPILKARWWHFALNFWNVALKSHFWSWQEDKAPLRQWFCNKTKQTNKSKKQLPPKMKSVVPLLKQQQTQGHLMHIQENWIHLHYTCCFPSFLFKGTIFLHPLSSLPSSALAIC